MGLTEVRVRVRGREDEVGVLLGRRMRVTGDRGAAGGEWLDDACVSAVLWCVLLCGVGWLLTFVRWLPLSLRRPCRCWLGCGVLHGAMLIPRQSSERRASRRSRWVRLVRSARQYEELKQADCQFGAESC